ncbi:MAG: ROK family transcriptional regulator [Treponema sp.]|nr:ROK family transcriptional regulator [Treponema sp.]
MNGNEKRILTILKHRGASTRKEISAACGISWAAVVKLVNRLESQGMIRCMGESARKTENGKTSLMYDIAEFQPLAIGIDIEYGHTTVTAQNLRQALHYSETRGTPKNPKPEDVIAFLEEEIKKCRKALSKRRLTVEGIGIGIPGMLIPSDQSLFERIAGALSRSCSLPVVADNNTRAYTLYLQKQFGTGGSFAAFIIRKGIGVGITLEGKLFRGYSGQAGELGHLPVDPSGPVCRCGKRGCVEAFFNQRELARSWAGLSGKSFPLTPQEEEERRLTEELFSQAGKDNPEAAALLKQKAAYLVPAVAGLLLSYDIKNIVINGHFGPDGEALIAILTESLSRTLAPRFRYSLSYRPIEDEGFAAGAAMLFQNKYYDYSILEAGEA